MLPNSDVGASTRQLSGCPLHPTCACGSGILVMWPAKEFSEIAQEGDYIHFWGIRPLVSQRPVFLCDATEGIQSCPQWGYDQGHCPESLLISKSRPAQHLASSVCVALRGGSAWLGPHGGDGGQGATEDRCEEAKAEQNSGDSGLRTPRSSWACIGVTLLTSDLFPRLDRQVRNFRVTPNSLCTCPSAPLCSPVPQLTRIPFLRQ